MATLTSVNKIGERETLAEVIQRVDSDETPIYSAAQKRTNSGIFAEFLVQELASAATDNHRNEGASMTDTGVTALSRFGNYHQISTRGFVISGTVEVVDKAGIESEVAYQTVLAGLDLRKDIEKSIGDTNVARSASEPRKSASLITWITNVDKPSDMAAATGDGSDVADLTGTAAALTLAKIDNAMQLAWTDGGNPRLLVASATNRANISDLTQSGTNLVTNQVNTTQSKPVAFQGAVSLLFNDFGQLEIIPSRFMSNDRIYLIDPDHVAVGAINGRNFVEQEETGVADATKTQILCEWTLMPDAPKAHAAVIGLNGS
jgi:hypothetical protein